MKPRALVVVASEMTVRAFLRPQLQAMQELYDVTLAVNSKDEGLLRELGVAGTVQPMPIVRAVSIAADVRALAALVRFIRTKRFDLVHSITPKAGLLAMAAARLARTPARIHTFTGQVWATRSGASRRLLALMDRIIARCATFTLADSAAQRRFLIDQRIVEANRIAVLGHGSVGGVDAGRFRPDTERRRRVRHRLGIPDDDFVILFVGRLTRDKGVLDLARAFAELARARADVRAVVVGPDEEGMRPAMVDICAVHRDRLHFVDFSSAPEDFMAAADVLCLPSYREGCGAVTMEGAAAGLPVVASRIYGLVDSVEDGRTGLLHEPGDAAGLAGCLRRLIGDPALRLAFGEAGRARAERNYSPAMLSSAFLEFYRTLQPSDGAPFDRIASADRGAIRPRGWYARFGKRAFDIAGAATAAVVLLPVCAVVAAVIRLTLGSPILFWQPRPGLNGAPFWLVKFRTMADRRDTGGRLLPDAERLTPIGRFLRSASLDELPELWNVLTGDMSLVGPRPLLMAYLSRYTPRQARRHEVRPGITGLVQVSGRNALSWDQKFELDLEYVECCSLLLDVKILALTVRQVIVRRGISQPGHATAEEFLGTVGR